MKLYIGPLSLFSRKVEIALAEKGLTVEQVVVPFRRRAIAPSTRTWSP
jgi:glutathione S-transferase